MKNILAILISCSLTFVLGAETFKVTEIKGVVLYRAPKEFKAATVALNQELEVGGRIKMGSDGVLTLTTPKQDIIKLSGDTYMKLEDLSKTDKGEDVVKLQLFKGMNRNKVHKLTGGEAFTIRTPVAVVGVRGTEFQCFVNDSGETQVSVLEGLVAIQDIDQLTPEVNVAAEQSASVKSDGQIQVKSVQNIEQQMQQNESHPSETKVESNEHEPVEFNVEVDDIIDATQDEQEKQIDDMKDIESLDNDHSDSFENNTGSAELDIDLETIAR